MSDLSATCVPRRSKMVKNVLSDITLNNKMVINNRNGSNGCSSNSYSDSSDEDYTILLKTPRKQKLRGNLICNLSVTPPKQKKIENSENEPITPTKTPIVLLKKLVISSPSSTTKSESEDTKVYMNARKALHSTFKTTMPGREKELEELRGFIEDHIINNTSGTMYISGPPGTGKTATLNLILEDHDISPKLKKVYINCTSIKSSGSVYSKIVKELGLKCTGRTEKNYLTAIENYLHKPHKMILLVLDEIDQLESKSQSVLYSIFELPANPKSKLILIGIANALDLTDRILPRLQTNCKLKPNLMHFAPYSKQQIIHILTARLKSAGVLDIFSSTALQLLAGKVAAISGDLRRALDIGRRVIEIVQQNKKGITDDSKPKLVELAEVMNVLNKVYGTSQNLDEDSGESFPLQQKIVICSLLLLLKKTQFRNVTVGKLHEVYKRICVKRNILAVDQAEFVGLCSLIETKGIMKVSGKKEPRLCKISLEWDEDEVASALKDKQLLSMILQDDSCLSRP